MNEDVKQRGEFDLPLSANISEIQVHHYMIHLQCDLHRQVFHGSTTVFFTHRANIKSKLEQKVCSSSSKGEVCEGDSSITTLESSDTVREPESSDTVREPESSDTVREPESSDTVRKPESSDTVRKPESSDTVREPESSDTVRKPESSDTVREPENSDTVREPENSDTVREPESSDTVRKPESSDTVREPESSDTVREPESSDTVREPESSDTVREPESSDTVRKPESSDTVREPDLPGIQPIRHNERLLHKSHNSGEKEDARKYNVPPRNVSYSGERKRDVNRASNSFDIDASPSKQMRNLTSSCEDAHVSANFLENLNSRQTNEDFTLILDCYKLEIRSVSEEKVETSINSESFSSQNWPVEKSHISDTLLQYELGDQCVKIQVPGHNGDADLRAIKVSYKTAPSGHSLKWTEDQDGNDCVYTHGHWINNRSLFPSQDVPEALATWQAYITVPQGLTVIMSGDHNPQCKDSINGLTCYYFWTAFPMPSSTLSLAVGHWTECKKPQIQDNEVVPYRVFSPEVLMTSMADVHRYAPVCMEAVTAVLGQYPMKRQDILVVPTSFDSLGMASPNVLYLSQSLLHPDLSMFYRLAHEVCHTWFGIVIGPADWTEEWLTEGFCTYLEDIIHTRVLRRLGKISEEEEYVIRDLRDLVKFRILTAELQNTVGSLQTLLPDCSESGGNKTFVKNGMNPEKKYLQVHYLKGYFLLRYLEKLAGSVKFLECLRKYVQHFHGKLVSSQEVLQFFIQECEEILAAGVTAAELSSAWLEYSGIPSALLSMVEKENNGVSYIKKQVEAFCASCKKRKTELSIIDELKDCNPDELLLFLELLLDENDIPWFGLSCLKKKYQIQTCNAEIKHRWCELVIKCKQRHSHFHGDIQDFLIEHQGMGVYLYGELMLSGKRPLINLAHKCFQQLQHSMSTDTFTTVHTMLFGE
ncbi:aminopeptidase O-like [Ostrea edulis]|uniref:aminopeptidase O-like n=1 Tax=Ostrea edulis TaxID=37623 RepID=UPI0024AED08A|nr:aminopeptidase O-like [Ostrea edulis]